MISYPVVVLDGALGRNGFMNVSGLNIYPNRSQFQQPTPPTNRTHIATVLLQPVTSKGQIGMCSIDVPVENIDALIAALKEAKKRSLSEAGQHDR